MNNMVINACQNCGNELKKLYDFGRYKDGSINTEFCNQCFRDGELLKDVKTPLQIRRTEKEIIGAIGKTRTKKNVLAKAIFPRPERKKGKSTV